MRDKIEEFERKMNEAPRFIKEMEMELVELKEGYARGKIVIKEKHLNPMGTVHGGLLFGLADTVAGVAAMTSGYSVVTLSSSINYLNAAANTEYIEAFANVVKDGRTTSVYDCMIKTKEGVDVCKVTITYFKVAKL